jgi:hypothetical protein
VILAALALVSLTGYLVYREYQFGRERNQWISERRELLNRIKPETAQVAEIKAMPELPEPVRTDEDYWAARGLEPYIPDDVQFTPDGFPITGASPFAEPPR